MPEILNFQFLKFEYLLVDEFWGLGFELLVEQNKQLGL